MSFFNFGNAPINSGSTAAATIGPVTNPTTATLLAEIDFNSSNATLFPGGQNFGVTWVLGCGTTLATFLCEQSQSTNLDMSLSTTFRQSITVQVSSGQSGQYFTKHVVQVGDRLRVRLNSSITGVANAYISAEVLT